MREAWRELGPRARYFFQTPQWTELLAERLDRGVLWRAVYAQDGRPAAVSVLRRSVRSVGAVRLTLLSQVRVGESQLPYADCLLDRDAFGRRSLRDLVELSRPWHVLWLTGLRAGSPWLELAGDGALVRPERDDGAGILDTRLDADASWRAVPKHMRHAVRNARHRIAALGGAEVVVATGGDLDEAFDHHVALEAAGWKGRAGTALSVRPIDRELLRDYLAVEPSAQIRCLLIGGRLAATQVAATVSRTLFLRRIAYDEQFAACSPSNVLMADLLETCCEDPSIDRIDCLAWQPWIPRWGMIREPTYSLVAFNHHTLRGSAAHLSRGGWERVCAHRAGRTQQLERRSRRPARTTGAAAAPRPLSSRRPDRRPAPARPRGGR